MPTMEERKAKIEKIRQLPSQLRDVVSGLSDEDLTTPYMEGEWTVAQNVHHLVDSHMNSYIRCKLILTAQEPPLIGYDQDVWAQFPDASSAELEHSLTILEGLHYRWCIMWGNMQESDWSRVGIHTEDGEVTMDRQLDIYSRHGEGHIDQIQRTLAAKGS